MMKLRDKVARKLQDFDTMRDITYHDRKFYYKAADRIISIIRIHNEMNPSSNNTNNISTKKDIKNKFEEWDNIICGNHKDKKVSK